MSTYSHAHTPHISFFISALFYVGFSEFFKKKRVMVLLVLLCSSALLNFDVINVSLYPTFRKQPDRG